MSKSKRYTKEQKHLIKQCIIDADIMGLGREEAITYVKSRLGLDEKMFSEGSYKKYRAEVLSDDNNVKWISYYARQGFVEFYRKRIAEMEMIQKETFKQWLVETNRADSQKDKRLILSLVAELRANNQHLASLGMVTPIIATIKNIIDDKKDKIGNTSKFIQNNPVQYQSSEKEEDNIDIAETNDTLVDQYLGKSTENIDKNRKF
jgi:hypothetical protein